MEDRAYSTAKAAAARYLRLLESLPGSIRAINYETMHVATKDERRGYQADDCRLENLDDLRDLQRCFEAAMEDVGEDRFRVWVGVRIHGLTINSEELGFSERTRYRILQLVDGAVTDALVERDLLGLAYGGVDPLERDSGTVARAVSVWLNPSA